jgi:hypothetical protein
MPPAAVTVAISQTCGSGRASSPGAANGLTVSDESGSGALGERQRLALVAGDGLGADVVADGD